MSDITYLLPMEAEEARQIVSEIRQKAEDMGYLLLELRDRQGWKALGYTSWTACLEQEFDKSRQHLYRLMWVAEINEQLSPLGYTVNSKQAVVLHSLSPETRQAVVQEAYQRDAAPTAAIMREVVQELAPRPTGDDLARRQVYGYAQKYSLIKQRMDQGTITPKQALDWCYALEACIHPPVRGDMLRMEIRDPVVISLLDERSLTDTYREIMLTGHLQFGDGQAVHVTKAKAPDVKRLFAERSKEHQRRAAAEKDAAQGKQEVVLTLWLNDPDRSAKMLRSMLGDRNAAEVSRLILNQTMPVSSLTASAVF